MRYRWGPHELALEALAPHVLHPPGDGVARVNFAVYVISAGRPEAVARLAPQLATVDAPVVWVVPTSDVNAYAQAGAVILEDPGSLVGARNAALDEAFARGLACVQLSDDLKRIKALITCDDPGCEPCTEEAMRCAPKNGELTLAATLAELNWALDSTGLKLAGCSPTDNLYFARAGVSTRKFIVGDLIMVRPTELRFDERLRLKEDYDFTLQHWATYGGAARCDYIAPSFAHYTNAGGAVEHRTAELEQETIAYLKAKWPGMIRDNPRRANEILLATPRRHR